MNIESLLLNKQSYRFENPVFCSYVQCCLTIIVFDSDIQPPVNQPSQNFEPAMSSRGMMYTRLLMKVLVKNLAFERDLRQLYIPNNYKFKHYKLVFLILYFKS